MHSIWWNKVTNASRFLEMIIASIQDGQSVILQLPINVPWYLTMKDIIETELIRQNSTSTYNYIVDNGEDPGEYLFHEFCKKEKRAHYRHGIGYAEFLAQSEDIVLNEYILWISGNKNEQAMRWYSFVENYNKALNKKRRGCLFIIEIRDNNILQDKKGIRRIKYQKVIEPYDNYLFNILAASSLKGAELYKQYLAEVVTIMIPNDIELSSACISYGREFLSDPIAVMRNVVESESRSDGTRFSIVDEEGEMRKRFWEAQIKVVFPLVEKHRNELVRKYKRQIEALLPIIAAYGEVFEEADDVELGTISYLVSCGKIQMTHEDLKKVIKLKNARNILAHIGILTQSEVDEIFAL